MSDTLQIVLRIIHIGAAIFWVGSFYLFFFFIQPTAGAIGPEGRPFMDHLVEKRKMPLTITTASVVAVLAGVLLYWRTSDGFNPDWITTGTGMAFTLGGLTAIVALFTGLFGVKPAVQRMGAIGHEVAASGGPPSGAHMAQLESLGKRLKTLGWVNFIALTFSVVAMAAARYL